MRSLKPILFLSFLLVFAIVAVVAAKTPAQTPQPPQIKSRVDLVVVPVTVKSNDGSLVTDLTADDFNVFEDGRRQTLSQFSNDPVPLSAVVLIDTGMGGDTLRSLTVTWTALSNMFEDNDEVETYRFDHFVTKLTDFTRDKKVIAKSFDGITKIAATKPAAADIPAEPLAGKLPDWLAAAVRSNAPPPSANPNAPQLPLPPPPSGPLTKAFHDAIFSAQADLAGRPTDRKVIIVISDGRVTGGNTHSLKEVQERLLREKIQFYGVGVDMSQPIIRRPFSILDSYATPTGGDVYFANSAYDIEDAVSHAVDQARNEYVLAYVSNNEPPKKIAIFRNISIKTSNPGTHVIHRNGYYQLPQP